MARTKGKLTKEQIVDLYATYSVNAIAEMDGTSRTVILRILHAADVDMRPRGHNDVRVAPVLHGHCRDAATFGMTPVRYVRLRAIQQLGGACDDCGETDLRVLDINHINGEGAARSANELYCQCLKVLDGEDTPNLQVLCCNCNRIHEYERGNLKPIPKDF